MPNALEKKAYRHIDIHVVREVAEYLMLTNLETTTLEVKDALRFAGYIAYQADVSHMMDVIAKRNPGWQYTCNGCLLYTSPSPRDLSTSRMPSSA